MIISDLSHKAGALAIRAATTYNTYSNNRHRGGLRRAAKIGIIVGAVIGGLILISLVACIFFCCRRSKLKKNRKHVTATPSQAEYAQAAPAYGQTMVAISSRSHMRRRERMVRRSILLKVMLKEGGIKIKRSIRRNTREMGLFYW
jgi:hypothetical protein